MFAKTVLKNVYIAGEEIFCSIFRYNVYPKNKNINERKLYVGIVTLANGFLLYVIAL